ncbi:MAG: DUF3617 domain-containing protein [Sphingomonadales bacterium]|nr:DUF3617 domain-containing protein [Sphingomonadales bacterium]MDE2570600.1 DUF3617 domain-containing protein [Sphingomonadales bacterium]
MRSRTARFAIAPLIALALAACSKQKAVDVHNESPQAVASKLADAGPVHFNPGRWETTIKIESLDLGNAPPEAKRMIQGMMGKARTVASCLTKEQADKPTPKFFGEKSDACTYDHFTMGGGAIDAKLDCKAEQGMQSIVMKGNYTPDTYQMTVNTTGGGHAGMKMDMTMSMQSRRVGDCTGKEDG